MIDLSAEKVLDELFTMNFSIAADLSVYNITPRLLRYLGWQARDLWSTHIVRVSGC